ncbi:hypothetical protein KY362_08420 [Candidatus Woesearchaeota archaeon]|nr:hypothetical protein [Candidatus Woesearchaeota archaeon]
MKLKLNDAIGSLAYDDLIELHEDLKEGGFTLRNMVEKRIVEKEKEQGKHCSICQSEIDVHSANNYTLLLGPEGLRRKASFCALDCLKYFITEIEKRKERLSQLRSPPQNQNTTADSASQK